jgi:hypothetical protein
MSILQKHLGYVNEQIQFQEKMMDKFAGNSFRQALHKSTRDKAVALSADLELADKELDKGPMPASTNTTGTPRLSLTPKELEGLPQEVLAELNLSQGDKTELAIYEIIESSGGIISLDRLLVALYRKTGEIIKRQNLTSKLYRMGTKDQVFSVSGKKGVYSNKPLSPEDVEKIFGNLDSNDNDSASPTEI